MYKAVTLAGGIREPLLTCSSFISISPEAKLPIWKASAIQGSKQEVIDVVPIVNTYQKHTAVAR